MSIPKLEITQATGETIVVTPNLFDTFAFEKLLKANPRMGGLQDNAMKLQAFRAWSAANRQGLIEQTWEQFTGPEGALHVGPYKEPETADDELQVAGLGLDTPTEA